MLWSGPVQRVVVSMSASPAEADPDRIPMAWKILGPSQTHDVATHLLQSGTVVIDDLHCAQEGGDVQPRGEGSGTAGGKHVIGPCTIIAKAHGTVVPHENGACVADPRRHRRCVRRHDLKA